MGGAKKSPPLPKSPAFSAPPCTPRAPPAPAPRQSPPASSRRKKRPRIPVPPLQRAFGVGRGAGQGDGGREEELSVAQMQASIEELLGMQGLGSGSWNKDGGVPAAVEREQRTLVREIKVLYTLFDKWCWCSREIKGVMQTGEGCVGERSRCKLMSVAFESGAWSFKQEAGRTRGFRRVSVKAHSSCFAPTEAVFLPELVVQLTLRGLSCLWFVVEATFSPSLTHYAPGSDGISA